MFMHPISHLALLDWEREYALKQRALERAARDGAFQRPGLARGGISSFARLLRRAAAAINLRPGNARRTSLTGSTGI
jgi:hypothetical protein